MPLFDYACRDCGHRFEMFVTSERVPSCPGCQSRALAKQLSSPGMVGAGSARAASAEPRSTGGCGAGGAGCACRMN